MGGRGVAAASSLTLVKDFTNLGADQENWVLACEAISDLNSGRISLELAVKGTLAVSAEEWLHDGSVG